MHETDSIFFYFFMFLYFLRSFYIDIQSKLFSFPLLNSFDIKILFLKMRDIANPRVNAEIGVLVIVFPFKQYMRLNPWMKIWERKLKRFE